MQIRDTWNYSVPGGLLVKTQYSDLTHFSSIKSALSYIREHEYRNKKTEERFFHTSDGRVYVKVVNGRTFQEFYSDGRRYYYFSQRIQMYRIK